MRVYCIKVISIYTPTLNSGLQLLQTKQSLKMMRMLNFRSSPGMLKQLRNSSSSSQAAMQAVTSIHCSGVVEKPNSDARPPLELDKGKQVLPSREKGKLVTAAFEKLKTLNVPAEMNDVIGKMIAETQELDGLLNIVKVKKLTKHHALKMVSVLADWTVEGKVKTTDFEMDPRFVSVCALLGSSPTTTPRRPPDNKSKDLNTVLGVASDDEAAKLISNISLSQMIKVLSTLASKKRRSTPLLRSLAFNISSSIEKLDIKQGADALYAVATLNFHDEMLVERVCADLCSCLMNNSRRAVVGSIIKSLGLLRYKHIDLLNLLSEWVENHKEVCAPQDLTSLLMTLAVVNHLPANQEIIFPMILEHLKASGVSDPHEWLDVVWALTVLNKESSDHLSSVLSPEFIDKIRTLSPDGLTVPEKLKLLNINGVAKLRMKDYKGPLLDLSQEWKVPLLRSKEKQSLVTSVQETMMNILPSAHYLATNTETDMGFIIDAECLMTTKFTPLPVLDKKTKERIDRSGPDTQKGIKVAILVWDYHDMTRGRKEPTGVSKLCLELTRLKGYRIVVVDFVDFNPRNKLVARVQYLNQKLKAVIEKS